MDQRDMSQNTTQELDGSVTPQDQAEKVREELEALDVWAKMGIDDNLKASIINAAAKATVDHHCPKRRSNRRLSVMDRTSIILSKIKGTMDDLNDTWDKIDMDEMKRLERVNSAYGHIESLLQEMSSAEYAMVTAIHDQIGEFSAKVTEIRRELGMRPFDMHAHKDKSLSLWKALDADLKELRETREKLIVEQKEVLDRFNHLTSRLGSDLSDETAASIPDQSVLAPHSTLTEMRSRCGRMEELLKERVTKMEEGQTQMNKWIQAMGCDYEEDVATVLEVDARAAETALTASLMEALEEMVKKLSMQYAEWLSSREFEYEECMVRLAELWEMCCVATGDRLVPPRFDPVHPDSIGFARDEVARLEEIYERKKNVYENIAKWKTHWQEKLQLESSENSKEKYTNRGGALEQRIKYERTLYKQLIPHAVQAVADSYATYLKDHDGDVILIDGQEPLDYIRHVTNTHELEREMEKEAKAQAKRTQLQQESKWGTTPGRAAAAGGGTTSGGGALLGRRPLGAAASASRAAPVAKMARVAEQHAANFTFDQSAISTISPTKRADTLFPKTSSPKGSRVTVAPGTRFASPGKGFSSVASTPKRPLVPSQQKK